MKTITVCPSCKKLNKVDVSSAKSSQPTCGHCQANLSIRGSYSELSASELQALIKETKKPIVVDFWAPWCGPCKSFAPHFQNVSDQLAEDFIFVKVNTEEHPLAGDLFKIRGIPTIAKFQNGIEKNRISGAMPSEQFKQWVSAEN